MRQRKIGRTFKKIGAALGVVLLAALFIILLAGFGHTAPENPMEDREADASRMYLTSSTLAMDNTQLEGVENANINAGEEGDAQEQEESEETQEEETEPQEENQQENQEEQAEQEEISQDSQNTENTNTDLTTPARDSLLSLIQKHEKDSSDNLPVGPGGNGGGNGDDGNGGGGNPGGNDGKIPSDGGQQSTLNPEASSKLFTTNLSDGTVTEPEYDLRIELTEKGKQLTLVSQNVTLNGSMTRYQNGDGLKLKEGINTVSVTLRFRDSKYNQIDASTRIYTIYYVPENHYLLLVKNLKTGEYLENGGASTVYEQVLWIEVIAKKGNTDVGARVRLNNATMNPDSDGTYRLRLKTGTNNLKVTVGSGVNQQVLTSTVTYQKDKFVLSFESPAVTEDIEPYRFGGYTRKTYESESPEFAFRISHSQITGMESIESIQLTTRYGTSEMLNMVGADGYVHCTLDSSQSGTAIYVKFTDSEGQLKDYTWIIDYKRKIDQSENEKKAPLIVASLTSETVHLNPYVLPVTVYDYRGNKLYPKNFQVYLNGERLEFSGISNGVYEYTLYLTEGPNSVLIVATDNEQYTATKELTVNFSPDEQSAQVHVIVSADKVGLGTLIDEYVTVSASETVAQVLEERLAAYGYTTIHDGSATDGGYFLRHIQKPGIAGGWSISDEQRAWLEQEGFSVGEPESLDSLGEKDFTGGSGWMVTLNYYFIGQSMGTRAIRDGDEIHLLYTLDIGNDVGVDPDLGIYD